MVTAIAPDGTLRKYEIRTLNDFLYVPRSRRMACLQAFEQALGEIDLAAIMSENPEATRKRPIVFTWVDDGMELTIRMDMQNSHL